MARKVNGYWQDFANVKRELLAFVAEHGTPGLMPTITELRNAGHNSLVVAIHKYHGDFHQMARRLDLATSRKPRGYWKDIDNVKRELFAFIARHGVRGTMPTVMELKQAGHGNLVSAIHEYHGDFHKVARRLDLSTPHKPKGYWKDFRNVKREVLDFIAEHGVAGTMPTEGELREAGHSSLTFAICEYHGDFRQVARRLDLSPARKTKNSNHRPHRRKHELPHRADASATSGMVPARDEVPTS